MPSIAVTKANFPHTNFGDIALVTDKSTIDPKASKKKIALGGAPDDREDEEQGHTMSI